MMTTDLIVNSPDKRDMKQLRDHWTNKRMIDEAGNFILQRKCYHKTSKNRLWMAAQKPPEEGGWPDLHGEDGKLTMKKTVFDGLIPNYFKQCSKSQMRVCCCKDCENARMFHSDYLAWAKQNQKELHLKEQKLKKWLEENPSHPQRREKRTEFKDTSKELKGFTEDNFIWDAANKMHQCRHADMESEMATHTCAPVNEKGLHPFKCCVEECLNCPGMQLKRGEHYDQRPKAKEKN